MLFTLQCTELLVVGEFTGTLKREQHTLETTVWVVSVSRVRL